MEDSLPLNLCHDQKHQALINKLHTLLHLTSLAFLFYYRASSFFSFFFLHETTNINTTISFFPFLLIFASEAILSFIWLLGVAYRWRPVVRTVFPERLPEDDHQLPPLDVFICTTDPSKEPAEQVMNTVLSAMSLDYPLEKLHVYVSDDGGSPETLCGLRSAWRFARWWLPFCRRYRVKSCCPKLYFSDDEIDDGEDIEFFAEKKKIKEKYEDFKEDIMRIRADGADSGISQDHPSMIEAMQENVEEDELKKVKLPLLVYVCREKRTNHPHHFKAGALNVLLRVSGVISNAPYFLVLDCDMMCNDPTSAKQALCFHLDPKISPSLAFVQFPHKFRSITKNDIYDSQLRSAFKVLWHGMDGLQGLVLSGTCFYAKRVALYGNYTCKGNIELAQLQKQFGSSNEFIKSLSKNYTPDLVSDDTHALLQPEIKLLASCNYETSTKWGQEVGFLYASVVEDVLTGFFLHCNGWRSVFCDPPKPQFLGTATTNLNDLLIQGIRWSSGLIEIVLSKFCPPIYGPFKMPLLQSSCYVELTLFPLYCLPICCFAIIPPLCLLHGIPLYPKFSNPYFIIFTFIFISAQCKHLQEVFTSGGSFQKWINEQRMWMIKSTTCHLYGCLNAILNSLNLRKSTFLLTNKVEEDDDDKGNDEQATTTLYQMDMFDFRTSHMFLVPMLAFLSINISCLVGGLYRVVCEKNWEDMLIQILISGYVIIVNYPIIEGLLVRSDKGRVPASVVPSFTILFIFIHLGFLLLWII